MSIGKIVKSVSQVRYQASIYHRSQVDCPPGPGDYALGSFVRIALRATPADLISLLSVSAEAARGWISPSVYSVGVIYDTVLLPLEPDSSGLHLSNEVQRELFSPDLAEERGVLVWIQLVGIMVVQSAPDGQEIGEVLYSAHGIPLLAAELYSEVVRMADGEVRSFHLQRDTKTGAFTQEKAPYLGYYGQLAAPGSALRQQVRLMILDHLERLFPEHARLLRLLKQMGGWQRLIGAMG